MIIKIQFLLNKDILSDGGINPSAHWKQGFQALKAQGKSPVWANQRGR